MRFVTYVLYTNYIYQLHLRIIRVGMSLIPSKLKNLTTPNKDHGKAQR